jgi:hypothetical protein
MGHAPASPPLRGEPLSPCIWGKRKTLFTSLTISSRGVRMLADLVQVITEDDIPLNGAYMAPTI